MARKTVIITKQVSPEKLRRQRLCGVSLLVIALNTVFAYRPAIELLSLVIMGLVILNLTMPGRVVLGRLFKKKEWANINVPLKTTFCKWYVAIPLIVVGVLIHSEAGSFKVSDVLVNFIYPSSEDISYSPMLIKLKQLLSDKLPLLISSLGLFMAITALWAAVVKNSQINYTSKQIKKIKDSSQALDILNQIQWEDFEKILCKFFQSKGYTSSLTREGSDGGIDILLSKNGSKEFVQAKHWKTARVGVSVVREIFGIVQAERMNRAFIITSGLFTQDAQDFASKVGDKIALIDGNYLIQIIKGESQISDHKLQPQTTPNRDNECSVCGGEMVMRVSNTNKSFMGCSNYPECRNTRELT